MFRAIYCLVIGIKDNRFRALPVIASVVLVFIAVSVLWLGTTALILAPLNRSSENIIIHPIVIAELEFRNVQRQVLMADLVEAAHDAALQERPKAVNGLGVNRAVDVLLFGMADDAMREGLAQLAIAGMLIGREQADFFGELRERNRRVFRYPCC
jgi:hypothetical protein